MKTNKQLKAIVAYALTYPQSIVVSFARNHAEVTEQFHEARMLLSNVKTNMKTVLLNSQTTLLLDNGSKVKFMSGGRDVVDRLRGLRVDAITFSSIYDHAEYLYAVTDAAVIR